MCGACVPLGPDFWQCSKCGTTNAVRFSVKCSNCSHPLVGGMTVPILKPKPQGK